ncbi:MAG: EF-hand domain-containing protein [Amaricoccus sp.]|uniref:EF-hand domain-containing protein n=1 Tax=Amaricoccus sp. TaxID=1872485 RepID=UPI0039E563F7
MPRISHIVAAAAFVGGLTLAGLAAAEPKRDRHDGPPPPFGGAIDFKAIDTDGNGSLSRAELMARATARIATADTDGNGSLDRAELAAALPGPQDTLVAVFSASPAERLADRILAETGNTETGNVTVQALAERQVNMLLAVADTDRDAAISQDEAEAMRPPRGFGPHGMAPDDAFGPGDGPGGRPEMRRGALGLERILPPSGPDDASDAAANG